jgi:hypothetical protein
MLLTILALLLGVIQSAAQDVHYDIAVGYEWAPGFTSCAGEDEKIFQMVTFPAVQSAKLNVGDAQWTVGNQNTALSVPPLTRRLRLRVLQAIADVQESEKAIANQIMSRLAGANFSCIKSDGVTVYLSQDTGKRKRDLEAVEQAVIEEATVNGTEVGEQGQRLLHACVRHRCEADCWCAHGTPYYCQFSC